MQVSGSIDTVQAIHRGIGSVGTRAHRAQQAEPPKPERVRDEAGERDGFEFKKSRLREARQIRKQEHRALFSAKKALKQIVRAVRDELKEIGRAADGNDVERNDADRDDGRLDGLNRSLRHLNRDFRHDVKQAFRDARDGRSLDGEQLVADTRAAFERLVSEVKSALDAASVERPAVDDLARDEAIGVAPVTVKPLEPADASDSAGIVEISASPVGAAEIPAEDNGPLTELIARVEQLLAKLTELLSPADSEDRPSSTAFTLEVAVTVYARATFSFEGRLSGTALDASS